MMVANAASISPTDCDTRDYRHARAISADSRRRPPSLHSLDISEWSAFGVRTETVIKIDRASGGWNAHRREPPRILLYNYGFFFRTEPHPHPFSRLSFILPSPVGSGISTEGHFFTRTV